MVNRFNVSGQLSPTLLKPMESLDLPVAEQQELGYMMFRDDFERVCFNFVFDSFSMLGNY